MDSSSPFHVVRVFTGKPGGGNLLGVFLDGAAVPVADRQRIAADLGFSETVFVDGGGRVAIFTPTVELPFAGHPLVGTAWLLASTGSPVDELLPPAGSVPVWQEGERFWIRGRADWAPEMQLRQLPNVAEVDAMAGAPPGVGFLDVWAWIDRDAAVIRSRVFAPAVGVPEDEATGAAAVRLVTQLDRPIEIHQGVGSVIFARPGPDGTAEIGGTCVLEAQREYVA